MPKQDEPAGEDRPEKPPPRRGQAVRGKRGAAAEFVPGPALQPKPDPFNAAAKAAELRLWWVSGKDRFVQMPAPDAPEGASALPLNREDVNLRLRLAGVRTDKGGATFSQADVVMSYIQENRAVAFAGEVGGWKVGVHQVGAVRMAITSSFRLIEPRPGPWPVIYAFLSTWFEDAGEAQADYFLAWLQTSIAALRAGVRTRPGYLLALVGPSNCGKTFAQKNLLKPLLGGRDADPLPYLLNDEKFNDDVARAECLSISELRGCKMDGASRADLAEAFKAMLVNPDMRLRAQYSSALMVSSFKRLSVSMNDEVDRLKVFPALNKGFSDKVLMLLCQAPTLPSTDGIEGWQALEHAIERELPAFAHYIEHEWQMPARLLEGSDIGRFGFRNYIHPRLAADMFEQEPESLLLHLLDSTLDLWPVEEEREAEGFALKDGASDLRARAEAWGWGKSETLREQVFAGPCGDVAKKAFGHSGGFAQCLGKLAVRMPDRIWSRHTNKGNVWLIWRPDLSKPRSDRD